MRSLGLRPWSAGEISIVMRTQTEGGGRKVVANIIWQEGFGRPVGKPNDSRMDFPPHGEGLVELTDRHG